MLIRNDLQTILAAMAMAGALMLGGGDTPAPASELALQLFMAIIAGVWFWTVPRGAFASISWRVWLVVALVLVLPAAQLVPLPPSIWHGLPGRSIEIRSLALVGQDNHWQPFSVTPDRTLASLLAMAPCVMMMPMMAVLTRSGRAILLAMVVAVAMASIVIGVGQVTLGDGNLLRFYRPASNWLLGFQTNHNSQGDLLAIAMIACAAVTSEAFHAKLLRPSIRAVLFLTALPTLVMLVAAVLTGSRAGMALVVMAVPFQLAILYRFLNLTWKRLATVLGAGVAAGVLALVTLANNPAIVRSISRFSAHGEFRWEIWGDTAFVIRQFWPLGSGIGSFIPTYAIFERLKHVSPFYANRAHDDFMELTLEAGLPGLVLLACIGGLLTTATIRNVAKPTFGRAQYLFATATLGLLAAHSLIDYPLRSMSLATITAACCAMLLSQPRRDRRQTRQERSA